MLASMSPSYSKEFKFSQYVYIFSVISLSIFSFEMHIYKHVCIKWINFSDLDQVKLLNYKVCETVISFPLHLQIWTYNTGLYSKTMVDVTTHPEFSLSYRWSRKKAFWPLPDGLVLRLRNRLA